MPIRPANMDIRRIDGFTVHKQGEFELCPSGARNDSPLTRSGWLSLSPSERESVIPPDEPPVLKVKLIFLPVTSTAAPSERMERNF